MAFFQGIRRLILAIFRKILFLWVRTQVTGATPEALGLSPQQPVCYVLQYSSLSSRLVLEQEVLRAGLPRQAAGWRAVQGWPPKAASHKQL